MIRLPGVDPTRLLPWLESAAVVAAVVVSAPLWSGCFGGNGFLAPVAAAPVVGSLAVLFTRGSGWRPLAAGLVVCVGYLLGAVAWPTFADWHPTTATWTALRDGLVGGWLRLLTQAVPLDTSPTLLVTPVLITFWAGWGAVFLVRRGRRPAAPVLPGLAAFLLGLLFGATLLRPSLPLTAGWLGAAATVILLRGNRFAGGGVHISRQAAQAVGLDLAAAQRRSLFGRLAFGVPTVLFVVAAGACGASWLPIATGAHRFDLRTEIAPPVLVQQTLSPLVTVQSQLSAKVAAPLFTVSGLPAGVDRIRVATLDSFDGSTWTTDRGEQYLPAGHRLAVGTVPVTGSTVTIRVTLSGLTGPFLPVLGAPSAIDVSGLGYDPVSGNLVAPADHAANLTYALTTTVVSTGDVRDTETVVTPSAGPTDTLLPSNPQAPQELIALANRITASASTELGKADLLKVYLQKLPYAVDVPPGHSYGSIDRMLFPPHPGDADAFAEQHASAFVVLARLLGIPARVAVGYVVDAKKAVGDTVTVTDHDAHAWAEVPVAGYGWVPFETVDASTAVVPPPKDNPVPKDSTKIVAVSPGTGAASGGTDAGTSGDAGPNLLVRSVQLGGLALAAVLVLPVVTILAEKRRRRWARRRARTSAGRVVGAWQQARDRLVERGLTIDRAATALEIAASARSTWGVSATAAAELAELVTRAMYAADEPDAGSVTQAWAAERRLRRDLAATTPWWRRVMAAADPRPLVDWHFPRGLRRKWRWAS